MTDNAFKIIAVDGGAASGKSSTSRGVAQRMKFLYVNSGSHYRVMTYFLLEAGISHRDPEAIEAALKKANLDTKIEDNTSVLLLNHEKMRDEDLRSPEINANVSLYAAKRPVRNFLLEYQRSQADVARQNGYDGIIMEGRDIGTVIFPDADFKFFLSASEDIREKRRQDEGQMDLVVHRDQLDSKRTAAPFIPADRSIKINTDALQLGEVIDLVCGIIMTGKIPGIMAKHTEAPFPEGDSDEEEGWGPEASGGQQG